MCVYTQVSGLLGNFRCRVDSKTRIGVVLHGKFWFPWPKKHWIFMNFVATAINNRKLCRWVVSKFTPHACEKVHEKNDAQKVDLQGGPTFPKLGRTTWVIEKNTRWLNSSLVIVVTEFYNCSIWYSKQEVYSTPPSDQKKQKHKKNRETLIDKLLAHLKIPSSRGT